MVKVDEMSSSRGMSAATHARDFESAMGLRRTGHLTSPASSSGKPASSMNTKHLCSVGSKAFWRRIAVSNTEDTSLLVEVLLH